MTLYARYVEPDAGYKFDRENCQRYLTLYERYLVDYVDMGQSFTTIGLAEFPKVAFNSVNFDFFDEFNNPHDIYKDPNYNPYLELDKE